MPCLMGVKLRCFFRRWDGDLVSCLGTPGEGKGEGDFEYREPFDDRIHPHPGPLPEYGEREDVYWKIQYLG